MVSLFNTLLSMASIILILSSLFSYNYGFLHVPRVQIDDEL